MKKMRRFLAVLVAMVVAMSVPAMAGEWVWPYEGESPTGRPTHYIKDDGTYAANEYLTIDGILHYFDYSGAMLAGNYSPDGRWFNTDGEYDANLSFEKFEKIKAGTYRWTNQYEPNDGTYQKEDVVISDIEYNSDDQTITGKVKFNDGNIVYAEHDLIEVENGTYVLTDTEDKYIMAYVTCGKPYRSPLRLKISIDGVTRSYFRIK